MPKKELAQDTRSLIASNPHLTAWNNHQRPRNQPIPSPPLPALRLNPYLSQGWHSAHNYQSSGNLSCGLRERRWWYEAAVWGLPCTALFVGKWGWRGDSLRDWGSARHFFFLCGDFGFEGGLDFGDGSGIFGLGICFGLGATMIEMYLGCMRSWSWSFKTCLVFSCLYWVQYAGPWNVLQINSINKKKNDVAKRG